MSCKMCAGTGHRTTAEITDDSFAQRPHPEHATAELDADGNLWIETPFDNGHGSRWNITLHVDYCPWCGEPLGSRP